jgi:hypothetical protein
VLLVEFGWGETDSWLEPRQQNRLARKWIRYVVGTDARYKDERVGNEEPKAVSSREVEVGLYEVCQRDLYSRAKDVADEGVLPNNLGHNGRTK